MKVLITGGTGFIGRHLVPALLDRGDQVSILTRKMPESGNKNVRYLLLQNGQIPLKEEFDVLINLAGCGIGDHAWTQKYKKEILESRLKMTHACVDFIKATEYKPKVFISSSAVGYYGTQSSKKLTEQDKNGRDFLADVCYQWEQAAKGTGVRTVILRTGIVLGLDGGALPKLVPQFKYYAGGTIGSGKQGFPWIHIDDVVGLILWSIDQDFVEGPVNVVAPETLNNAQISKILAKVLGKPSLFVVPTFLVKTLLGERAMLLTEGQFVIPEFALKNQYQFKFSNLEAALRDLLK
jgi:uncharacterized protein (TIGR01777 family)